MKRFFLSIFVILSLTIFYDKAMRSQKELISKKQNRGRDILKLQLFFMGCVRGIVERERISKVKYLKPSTLFDDLLDNEAYVNSTINGVRKNGTVYIGNLKRKYSQEFDQKFEECYTKTHDRKKSWEIFEKQLIEKLTRVS